MYYFEATSIIGSKAYSWQAYSDSICVNGDRTNQLIEQGMENRNPLDIRESYILDGLDVKLCTISERPRQFTSVGFGGSQMRAASVVEKLPYDLKGTWC